MGFKFNPLTGQLDLVGQSSAATTVPSLTMFKRSLTINSDSYFTCYSDSSARISSYDGFTNNQIFGHVTVEVDGSVRIKSFASIKVGA